MSKGDSGRIVIEVEPMLKRQLYSTLAMESSTLKDWFIQCAENYVRNKASSTSKENNQNSERRT
ncbi:MULTISPECIES: hypothetical protein [unclassified Brucella]|uniref:hypothetical protein n=1 Tax=unclassified Brucella TaxID=2632610 RepID=UPI0012976DAA|nr:MULTISPECIES: hypothetical protein [unclassified Brucella]QGA58495.1 hypothetical protein GHC20_15790 [Brucella sp. 2280]UWF68174.1 hypothetical protein NYO63_10430 [Brucella sp. 1315]UWF71291.1 hypothetical protein NYO65_10425 [Brucella sp. 2594]